MPAAVGRIGVTLRRKWMTMFKIHSVRERRGAACRGCLLYPRAPHTAVRSQRRRGQSQLDLTYCSVSSESNELFPSLLCPLYLLHSIAVSLFLSLCHSPSYHNSCLGLLFFDGSSNRVVVQHAILHGSRRLFFSNFPCILIGKRVFAVSASCFDVFPRLN